MYFNGNLQNSAHTTKRLEHSLEIPQNSCPITIHFYYYCNAYHGYKETHSLFNKIGLKMVEISMFKDVKTWSFHCYTHALPAFSIEILAVRSPSLANCCNQH